MTQQEIFALLKTTGYQVAYNNFIVDDENEAPEPPYITFIRTSDKNVSSDAKVHGKFKSYQIELYTKIKDVTAENVVENVIDAIDTEYETSEDFVKEVSMYQVVYQLKTFERR